MSNKETFVSAETSDEECAAGPYPDRPDLSKDIEQWVERKPDERARVVRVFEDFYRCNWWVRDKIPHPFWLATGTIRKSGFLRATKANDVLLVEQMSEGIKL